MYIISSRPSWQGSIKERTLQQIIEALEFDCKVESLKIRKTPKAGPDIRIYIYIIII